MTPAEFQAAVWPLAASMLATIAGLIGLGLIAGASDEGRPGLAIIGALLFAVGVVVMLFLGGGPIGGGS